MYVLKSKLNNDKIKLYYSLERLINNNFTTDFYKNIVKIKIKDNNKIKNYMYYIEIDKDNVDTISNLSFDDFISEILSDTTLLFIANDLSMERYKILYRISKEAYDKWLELYPQDKNIIEILRNN